MLHEKTYIVMDYKSILLNYITEADATKGFIVYQPCDGLIEVCKDEKTKSQLIDLVKRTEITNYWGVCGSAYCELIGWAQKHDLLLESSEGVLFCIPKPIE